LHCPIKPPWGLPEYERETTMRAAEFEIEEHVAEHNRFFQRTRYTLNDLDVYADAFVPALQAVYCETMTDQQASEVMLKARADARAIDVALELADAA
jgi:hypothetical protein